MFCSNCGAKIDDTATFCGQCGTKTGVPSGAPAAPPPPAYAPPPPAYAQPAYAPPPPPPPPKKKRHGCLIAFLVFLLVVAVAVGAVLAVLNGWFIAPGYSSKDFASAMDKIGLTIDFEGKDEAAYAAWIKSHKGQKVYIEDYEFVFSDYEERSFSLTEGEANAFCNLIAPNMSWFDKVKLKINDDGSISGDFKVDFAKIKKEIIPDLIGEIPDAVMKFLPGAFTLSTRGSPKIVENQVVMEEPLSVFNIGPLPLQPIIQQANGGEPLDEETRQGIYDVAGRIYEMIPDLRIHFLGVEDGEFVFSGYMPTHVTVTEKG
jgi:hypothetical protein